MESHPRPVDPLRDQIRRRRAERGKIEDNPAAGSYRAASSIDLAKSPLDWNAPTRRRDRTPGSGSISSIAGWTKLFGAIDTIRSQARRHGSC